ncbi:MAG: EfeM/EfeO family lipoprotein [Deltaproteobacteria bacterium]|nr:EfeM/EfeO family lipoprotein [Deltaproteobacteria bacterium]
MSKKILLVAAVTLAACSSDKTPAELKVDALTNMKGLITTNLDALVADVQALSDAAPDAQADGWTESRDRAAVELMKARWKRARQDYEHVEGAIAVLFPELDVSTDERYDGFVETNGADEDPFDDQNVTGVHAIERILWADAIPDKVKTFEQGLPNDVYRAARWPQNATEASDFKDKLVHKLLVDVTTMRDEFKPLALDPAAAWRGVTGSMHEQVEKAEVAASGAEESRYAQYTLADMRANLDAGLEVYAAFQPWIIAVAGDAENAKLSAGFDKLKAAYARLSGDALPDVPATWSSQSPSSADLATPFGQLWKSIADQADETASGALVYEMNVTADKLGIAALPQ